MTVVVIAVGGCWLVFIVCLFACLYVVTVVVKVVTVILLLLLLLLLWLSVFVVARCCSCRCHLYLEPVLFLCAVVKGVLLLS